MKSKILFGDIAKFSNGKTSPERDDNAKYNVFGSNGIIGKSNLTNTEDEIVIIGRVGSYCGSVYFSKHKCWVTDNAIKCEAKKDNVPSFIYYQALKLNLNNFRVGSGQPLLNQGILNSLEINYFDPHTQKKIAHILSTLDDKIELNRKMNQTLEEMAQALFKSWFVDFDPVHVKMGCANDEELEVAARELGISKEVLELFPSEFEESELGMIPEGWEVVKIEKILKRYKAPKRYKKDAVKSYGRTMVIEQGSDIILGYHDNDGEFKATVSEPMFIFGDHTCIMKLSTKPFSISENVIPLSGCIRNGYWTYYATYGQQTFQEYRRHWSELIVRDTVLADEAICDFFAEQVQSLILKIEQNILENNELIMTRDTLLPKLLSGELDVSELDLEI